MTFRIVKPTPVPPCKCRTRFVGTCCLDCDGHLDRRLADLESAASEVGTALKRLCEENDLDSALDAVLRIWASQLLATVPSPREEK